jgi:hypothetical protein
MGVYNSTRWKRGIRVWEEEIIKEGLSPREYYINIS